jgi:hypothetical protein
MSQMEKTKSKTGVDTEVAYLPSPKPFERDYPEATTLATVRSESMTHFGVQDYNDRDRHEFHLEHNGQRVDDSATIGSLVEHDGGDDGKGKDKEKHKHVRLDLVEQVTAGAR